MIFFSDTAATEIYTLALHDALPIEPDVGRDARPLRRLAGDGVPPARVARRAAVPRAGVRGRAERSEEHTSELQSRQYLVCRILLEKKQTLVAYIPLLLYSYCNNNYI